MTSTDDITLGKYYQFPVALLRNRAESDSERILTCLRYAIGYVAASLEAEHDHDKLSAIAERLAVDRPECEPLLYTSDGSALLAAAETLGVKLGNLDPATYREIVQRYANVEHGQTQVRIGRALFWAMRQDEWPWLLFATLCAVNAAIGNKPYHQTTLAHIHALALGYDSKRHVVLETATENQIKKRVAQLHRKELISKFSVNQKHWYYSSTLPQPELEKKLIVKAAGYLANAKLRGISSRHEEIRQQIEQLANANIASSQPPIV